jgi:hypothetical protein
LLRVTRQIDSELIGILMTRSRSRFVGADSTALPRP